MAKTFGCEDVEDNGCQWRMFVEDGEEDIIVESTLQHAQSHHPEFAADRENAEGQIRAQISDLLRQSKYYEQKSPGQ
jgi:predicted small metal-binding protein